MDTETRRARRTAGQGWLSTLLGVFVLVAGGFALGLVVGVISEEPELVAGHLAGQTTEIAWAADGDGVETEVRMPGDRPTGAEWDSADVAAVDRDEAPASRALPSVAAPAPSKPKQVARSTTPTAVQQTKPSPPESDPSSTFAIQVGAFQDPKAAQGIASRLRAGGYPVQVLSPESDDRWRVRVGPMNSRTAADETAERLKVEENLPTWVLRERGP